MNKQKEEAIEAKNLLDAYNQKIYKKHVKPLTCICCKQQEITPQNNSELPTPLKQEKGIWDDGGITSIHFSYGSEHDGNTYYLAICDKCVSEFNYLLINHKNIKEKYYKDLV